MIKNEHVYVICCRPEVDSDVISGRNIQTLGCYATVNFEVASFSSFRYFSKRSFCDSDVGDGSSGMNVIYSRSEVADDVISREVVDTF